MDNKKTYTKKERLKDYFKYNSLSGSKIDLFQYCKNNTEEHEETKFKVFKELIKKGFDVLVEPEFKNNIGRPDIVCFDKEGNGYIFEIVNSESEKSKTDKIVKYPLDFELIFINCNKEIELAI